MMTDEQRKLCAELRNFCTTWPYAKAAADEIERLAATIFELKVTEDKRIADLEDEIERLIDDVKRLTRLTHEEQNG